MFQNVPYNIRSYNILTFKMERYIRNVVQREYYKQNVIYGTLYTECYIWKVMK